MARRPAPNITPPTPVAQRATEAAVIALAVLAALAVRAWAFSLRGVVDYDETYYYILGTNLLSGRGYTLNGLPHVAFPPLYPLLVGVAGLFTSGISAAASTVSALAGALLPAPVYFLARSVHGKRAAAYAALLSAVWPALFFFSAETVPYAYKLYFGSEPLFVTLLAAGFLFAWRFARQGGFANAALAGAAFGLASLVRSEGPVIFAFTFGWILICRAAARGLLSARAAAQAALVAAAMLAVFSPFLIYMRSATGRWTLGAKVEDNVAIRRTMWDWAERDDNREFMAVHYAISADGTDMEESYWGISPQRRARLYDASPGRPGRPDHSGRSCLSLLATPDARWLWPFARGFAAGPVRLVPYYAWPFVLLGLALGPHGPCRRAWWGLIAAALLPLVLIALTLYTLPRFQLPLVVFFIVATAKGLCGIEDLIVRACGRLFGGGSPVAGVLALVPTAVLLMAMLAEGAGLNAFGDPRFHTSSNLSLQPQERAVSGWLAANLPARATLLSNKPWIAVEAGLDWRVGPTDPGDKLLTYAAARGIDFALLHPWELERMGDAQALDPCLAVRRVADTDYRLYDFRRLGAPVANGVPQ